MWQKKDYVLQNTRNFIQELLDLGARKIGVVGIPPIGCVPIVRTLNPKFGCISFPKSGLISRSTKFFILSRSTILLFASRTVSISGFNQFPSNFLNGFPNQISMIFLVSGF
ncbi:hypothetical protein ACHQM5_013594 [Ranunculus cassubicifolius]